MSRILLSIMLVFLFAVQLHSQQNEGFNIEYLIKTSPLKDQQSSGTCWSFATTSFIETEAIRLGNETVSLSPIYYVTPTYLAKAEKYIKRKGKSWFDAGDLTFSVLDPYKLYGAVPETIYDGIIKDDWQHDHLEMDNLLYSMVESIGASGYGRIKPNSWKRSIEGVLNSYLGIAPDTFFYNGIAYTGKTFADKFVGINPDDYVEITSYSHHIFYDSIVLDIPANWNNKSYLNVPINDFEEIIDHALKNGFSLAWDGDASEPNFNFDSGVLELREEEEKKIITQNLRQIAFEDKATTDDHNMHIIGIANNGFGNVYYIMKNSEGSNDLNGYIYISKKALLLKTISVLVNKDAIPESIRLRTYLNY